MSRVEASMLSALVLLALTGVAVIATRRAFWLFGLSRMRWVTGKLSLAAASRNDQAQIAIGLRETYAYRNRTWERDADKRITPAVLFTPDGGEPTPLAAAGARWLFPARRWQSGSETEVERAVRDGDAVTLVFATAAKEGKARQGYRDGAPEALAPHVIFAGDMREAKSRHRAALARVAFPFLVIAIAAGYLARVELALPVIDPATMSQP